ncbi:urea ABC transporter permease subunit UrtB [Methyloterricola oryzae]|uniref:urea ABC transporter permease subunit UrtB n=1 Tax=Methyloterricola oryzae TaxID=1495050 RepID=UPI0005EB2361|nr:urea ABC transporter permease subunit UrtB [Methyloterricola oryzae]
MRLINVTRPKGLLRLLAGVLLSTILGLAQARADEGAALAAALQQLKDTPLAQMGEAVDTLAAIHDARVPKLLKALLEGQLFYRKSDGKVVTATASDEGYAITDALSGESLGSVGRFDVKKLAINNTLRNTLTGAIARLELTVGDAQQRLRAVKAMSEGITEETEQLLRAQLAAETDPAVRQAIETALALADLSGEDKEARLAAIRSLEGNLDQEVRNRLSALLETDDEGNFVESDADVRNTADAAVKRIEFKVQLNQLVETLFFGLSLGAVLVLSAIGLAITFGVMGVINMAHGELMMIGAYTTYVVQLLMPGALDWSLAVAVPAAFLISGLFGIAIERGIIRVLYGRPLETLLATFGVSLFLQQLVRSIFSPLNRSVSTPAWMSGSVEINSALSLTLNRLYIVGFSLLVFAALLAILKRTRLGLEVRAVAQNRAMARAMGIRTGWVDAMTFGLGSGIAGVAGVALSQLTNVGPNLGQAYIVDSFMVVVFGGVGNLWGTLVGGIGLGVVNKLLEPYAGAVLAKILILVFIIVFIQKRPRGLFPQKGRAVEG